MEWCGQFLLTDCKPVQRGFMFSSCKSGNPVDGGCVAYKKQRFLLLFNIYEEVTNSRGGNGASQSTRCSVAPSWTRIDEVIIDCGKGMPRTLAKFIAFGRISFERSSTPRSRRENASWGGCAVFSSPPRAPVVRRRVGLQWKKPHHPTVMVRVPCRRCCRRQQPPRGCSKARAFVRCRQPSVASEKLPSASLN